MSQKKAKRVNYATNPNKGVTVFKVNKSTFAPNPYLNFPVT